MRYCGRLKSLRQAAFSTHYSEPLSLSRFERCCHSRSMEVANSDMNVSNTGLLQIYVLNQRLMI
jgi:hypothetical protein